MHQGQLSPSSHKARQWAGEQAVMWPEGEGPKSLASSTVLQSRSPLTSIPQRQVLPAEPSVLPVTL